VRDGDSEARESGWKRDHVTDVGRIKPAEQRVSERAGEWWRTNFLRRRRRVCHGESALDARTFVTLAQSGV